MTNSTKGTQPKTVIVLHQTLGNYSGAISWLKNPASKSSAHTIFSKDGKQEQIINYRDDAWHAGNIKNPTQRARKILQKKWGRYINPNLYTIGFEIESETTENGITDIQIENIVKEIINISKMNIGFVLKTENIITHKDIAKYKPKLEKTRNKILKKLFAPQTNWLKELKRDNETGGFYFVKDGLKQKVDSVNGLLTIISREFGVENLSTKTLKQYKDTDRFF